MKLTSAQLLDLRRLHQAIRSATDSGLMDILAAWGHPDTVNGFCDLVEDFHNPEEA